MHRPSPKLRPLTPARQDAIHRALLAGLLSNIGAKSEGFEYTGAHGTKFHIFPGSALFSRKPPWVMSAELVQTTKLYARTVGAIKPEWLERIAPHLLKRSYTDPHWQAHSGHVVAFEKVTLFGLTLVPRRSVHYGPIEPRISRQLFIHHALVQREWFTNASFFRHNLELIEQIQQIESKTRKRDLLVDIQAQFDFYDKRIPSGVYNGPLFEKWRRQAEAQEPRLLYMTQRDLMNRDADLSWEQFPDQILINGMSLPLEYRLEPGVADDGITVTVPLATLNQLPAEPFEWLVPGLLAEKLIALLRSLPKALRTSFVPAPENAAAALPVIRNRAGSLLNALSDHLGKQSGLQISPHDFQLDTLPDHLLMNFRVVDEKGRPVGVGRDLLVLRQQLGSDAQASFVDPTERRFHRDKITSWDFGELPASVPIVRHGMQLTGFPALVDAEDSVSLRLLDTADAAQLATRAGLRRLLLLQLPGELKRLSRQLDLEEACLHYATLGDCASLREEIVTAAAERALFVDDSPLRTREEFVDRAQAAWRILPTQAQQLAALAGEVLASYHALQLRLDERHAPLLTSAIADLRSDVAELVGPHFMTATPPAWLPHLPRFLKAAEARLKKLTNAGLSRDDSAMTTLRPLLDQYRARRADHAARKIIDPAMIQFRWMLQELRVSLFAQELRTSIPISVQRLEQQWAKVIS